MKKRKLEHEPILSMRLRQDIDDALKRAALADRRTKSELARNIIEDALREQGFLEGAK